MQILLIMLIVVFLAFSVLLLALAKQTKSQGKADRRQRAGRIHQGLCRNSKTDRRKYEEVRTLESNCDISDHL